MIKYASPTPDEAVGYMKWHLKGLGPIYSMLDIGMAHGHFSKMFHELYPDAAITGVECNERDKYFLNSSPFNIVYACLGSQACEQTFYVNPDDIVGGGSSFYKERTGAFSAPISEMKQIQRLDDLFAGSLYDFIKIDTQGSELDIIEGGKETIRKAKYLLLELSFVPYNEGAPLIDDILPVVRSLGFRMIDTFGPTLGGHCWGDKKIQVDALFTSLPITWDA
jgi:FkbM family methyltransferase